MPDEKEINFGLGMILTDLVAQLEKVQEEIIELEMKVGICNRDHQFSALK